VLNALIGRRTYQRPGLFAVALVSTRAVHDRRHAVQCRCDARAACEVADHIIDAVPGRVWVAAHHAYVTSSVAQQ
jgi:hypothetical protein